MNIKTIFKIIGVVAVLCLGGILAFFLIPYLLIESGNGKEIIFHDVSIYEKQKYKDESEPSYKMCDFATASEEFIPAFDKITYEYSAMDYYMYDGQSNLTDSSVSIVLDLQFDSYDNYNKAKDDALKTYPFLDITCVEEMYLKYYEECAVFEFDLGSFHCQIVGDETFECIPGTTGIICYSDENMILRYVYFKDIAFAWELESEMSYIKDCTSCKWD